MLLKLQEMALSRVTAAILTIGLALSVTIWAPSHASLILFKICLVTLASMIGLWIDRVIFPEARVHVLKEDLDKAWDTEARREKALSYNIAQARRAAIVLATVLGICLGM